MFDIDNQKHGQASYTCWPYGMILARLHGYVTLCSYCPLLFDSYFLVFIFHIYFEEKRSHDTLRGSTEFIEYC